jgi:hypothetical protein
MKLVALAAALLAVTACERAPSKLDQMPGGAAIPSGDLEARVARLEKKLAKVDADALNFLASAYEMQVEQQTKPVAGTVYGVDIAQNLQIGQTEGAPDALVTIVEAFDFA